jgi:hypothetical protein
MLLSGMHFRANQYYVAEINSRLILRPQRNPNIHYRIHENLPLFSRLVEGCYVMYGVLWDVTPNCLVCHSVKIFLVISWVEWNWVRLACRQIFHLIYLPRMTSDDDDDERGAVGEMRFGRGNWSTRIKTARIHPPQIPHYLTWNRIRADVLGRRRLTRWSMARPFVRIF